MKLLVLTQVMDQKDPALGFFQKWVAALAPRFKHIEVICLREGEYSLPANVTVHSLGKESVTPGRPLNRVHYVLRFFYLVWVLRNDYDAVFVHMNQEYVLLGGPLWKLLGKKVFMWRNHYEGNVFTRMAGMLCDKVFCTSKFSYTARFKNTVLMPVGVDPECAHTEISITRKPRSILFLGRLDRSKRPDLLLDALGMLAKQGTPFAATFVGGPSDVSSTYPHELRAKAEALGIAERVAFVGAVPSTETYSYYRSHEIFVNCSKSGMFDKTMFEAVVCGCLLITASRDVGELAGQRFVFGDNDAAGLAKKLIEFLSLSDAEQIQISKTLATLVEKHNLPTLVLRLEEEIMQRKSS